MTGQKIVFVRLVIRFVTRNRTPKSRSKKMKVSRITRAVIKRVVLVPPSVFGNPWCIVYPTKNKASNASSVDAKGRLLHHRTNERHETRSSLRRVAWSEYLNVTDDDDDSRLPILAQTRRGLTM